MFITSYKIGEVHFRWLGTNGCHEMKDLFTAAGSPCRHNFNYVNFTSFGGLRRKTAGKSVPHVQHDYFFLIQPIKSLICGVVVAVAAVVS